MLHAIPVRQFGAFGDPMAEAVSRCVHCGFCLAACPTYRELGQEMDSPRGRIVLMKSVLEGAMPWTAAQPHVERCLGCLACEPACPSGVPYRDLISPFRALAASRVRRPWGERFRRYVVAQTLPHPRRFRWAVRLGTWARRLWLPVPGPLQPMTDLLPAALPPAQSWPERVQAVPPRRARVALLAGCAQQVLAPDILSATVAVLTRNGVEVRVPSGQGCCGGLSWHTGDQDAARHFARVNLAAFPSDVDAILTTAAGCGSALHEYPLMLRGTDDEGRARELAGRVEDVSVFLARLGLRTPLRTPRLRVAYHDACHLVHAQGVRQAPRNLLRSISGVELVELSDPEFCCGSAGSYNLDQPELASSLGRRKAQAVVDSGADLVVSGNIGCLNQLEVHLKALGRAVPVRHTVQVIRDSMTGNGAS
ncbi:MAG: 4Fe-4S dicluster domain-containing protein [Verrucomicrobiae bacterium]|nr:4Fe-4S dicluster domain-containing protein [Verrucomicrobiae bacterium]